MLQHVIGWTILLLGGFLYLGQIISSIDFPLAQRMGLQEDPDASDPVLQRSERYTAYWDLLTLGWMPLAGVFMVLDHPLWPLLALTAGAIYFDTSGREASKFMTFRHEGVRMGTEKQQVIFFISYIVMAVMGLVLALYALNAILPLFHNIS